MHSSANRPGWPATDGPSTGHATTSATSPRRTASRSRRRHDLAQKHLLLRERELCRGRPHRHRGVAAGLETPARAGAVPRPGRVAAVRSGRQRGSVRPRGDEAVSGLSDEAYIERLEREANKLEADVATLTAERDRLREESETLGSFAEYQGGLIDASVAREHA